MIRKLNNSLNKRQVEIISTCFNNIKSNTRRYPIYVNEQRIVKSYNILEDLKLRKIHNDIIYPKVKSFKNSRHLILKEAFLEWSISENSFDYDRKLIQAVICNKEIQYEYWFYNIHQDILKPNQILILDYSTNIRFYNYNISDLAFFYYIK